ncbi:MAG: hypothetical protein ABI639_06600 [Thermoanaerobaculia bacterium]
MDSQGAFELSLAAAVTDRILLHVLVPGGNEEVALLGPFLSQDGRGAFVGPEGATFTTVDGWSAFVMPATFDTVTSVRVQPQVPGNLPIALPESFIEGVSFVLDFGGARAAKPIELSLPAPPGVPAARPLLVLREVQAPGAHGWMLHELATIVAGRLETLTVEGPGQSMFAREQSPAELDASALQGESGELLLNQSSLSGIASPLGAVAPSRLVPGLAFAGHYALAWSPQPLGFFAFPFGSLDNVVVQSPLNGLVTVLNSAITSMLEFDSILIPTLLGEPVSLTVRDGDTGFVLFQEDVTPPASDGGVAEIPPEVFGDTSPPYPIAGSPLRCFVLDLVAHGAGELQDGISWRFEPPALTIHGREGSVDPEVKVHLAALNEDSDLFTTATAAGSFDLSRSVSQSGRYLLTIGGRIDGNAPLDIDFNEALDDDLAGVHVVDDAGRDLGVRASFRGSRSSIRVLPPGAWPVDRNLRLTLSPELSDSSGNRWERDVAIDFIVGKSRVIDSYPFTKVNAVLRMGTLLFVAAEAQGIAVLDASDPANLRNLLPGGLTFPLPFGEPVRAIAMDSHGRLIVAGGGVANFGILRIFDPQVLPEILAATDPAAARGMAWRGTTIISDRLGGTGTQLPSGTPREVVVFSDDLSSTWRAGEPAPDGLITELTPGSPGEPDGTDVRSSIGVTGSGAAGGAPVTLRNLDRGSFRREDAASDGAFHVDLEVEPGDRLQLLRHRREIAYVATLGAGIEAVDIDAFYHSPNEPSPVASAVIGIYSGSGDPALSLCNEPSADLANALVGIDALVEAASSPPIDLVGVVAFRGLAEIESPPSNPGSLTFLADACAEIAGSRTAWDVATEVDFPWDMNGDGRIDAVEKERDVAVVAHATAGLLVYDLTVRNEPVLRSRVSLPLAAVAVSVNRNLMRAYVSGASGGVAIVDLSAVATTALVDADGNGVDDRVLEVIPVQGIASRAPTVVEPDLGIAFISGDGGVASVGIGLPSLRIVAGEDATQNLPAVDAQSAPVSHLPEILPLP